MRQFAKLRLPFADFVSKTGLGLFQDGPGWPTRRAMLESNSPRNSQPRLIKTMSGRPLRIAPVARHQFTSD